MLGLTFSSINSQSDYAIGHIMTKEYTSTEDCTIYFRTWGSGGNGWKDYEFQFWVEIDKVTNYEKNQFQTYTIPVQQPFRKIDEYEDTFIRKNGKWYERHYINRCILTGTEDWNKNVAKGFEYVYYSGALSDNSCNSDFRTSALSNYYKYKTNYPSNDAAFILNPPKRSCN